MSEITTWDAAAAQRQIEAALRRTLGLPADATTADLLHDGAYASKVAPRLWRAMAYSTLAGGKRLRPLLVLATAAACGASSKAAEAPACAVEFLHTYSLIHDDLPDMDDDDLRRGRPTCHRAFDPATAILAGDALQSLAYQTLARAPLPAERQAAMVAVLATAAGPGGMAGGQMRDITAGDGNAEPSVGGALKQLETTHRMKTGALFRACVRLGALCRPGTPSPALLRALDTFADRLGLAFQVIDDLLDGTADTATLGKPAGSDADRALDTYLTLLGAAGTRARAEQLHEEAQAALSGADLEPAPLLALAERFSARRF